MYRLGDDLALILTTDFFTPVVDRPYDFGAVAAANALSDVYAMGGTPLAAALSLVGFPTGSLGPEVLAEILRGAVEKLKKPASPSWADTRSRQRSRSSAWRLWGESIPSCHHERWCATRRFPDPHQAAGTGNHNDGRQAEGRYLEAISEAITVMTTLNRDASRSLQPGRCSRTDGRHRLWTAGPPSRHGRRQQVSAQVWADLVPILPAARAYVRRGMAPGGTHANLKFLSSLG